MKRITYNATTNEVTTTQGTKWDLSKLPSSKPKSLEGTIEKIKHYFAPGKDDEIVITDNNI